MTPSSALRIFWGFISVIKEREREMKNWELSLSLSLSCGSSKQPWWGQLRGCCMTSQAENGPCPFLPCSISFSSCLSFVMDTACNKKSQHIYGVADPAGARRLHLPATKQLCYPLRIQKAAQGYEVTCCFSYASMQERIAFFLLGQKEKEKKCWMKQSKGGLWQVSYIFSRDKQGFPILAGQQ